MRDPILEARLRELGVAFEYREYVAFSDINDSVQARLGTDDLIQEEVRKHETNARNIGTSGYPPTVLGRLDGRLFLLDGHQRRAGFRKAGVKGHDAYEVAAKSMQEMGRVAKGINVDHGLPPSEEERLELAKAEVKARGSSRQEAATRWRVPLGSLSDGLIRDRVYSSVVTEGASPSLVKKIPTTTMVRLNKIRRSKIQRGVAEAIARSGMKGTEAWGLIDTIAAARSDDDARAVLAEYEAASVRASASRNGKKRQGPGTAVRRGISRSLSALAKHPAEEIPHDEAEAIAILCERLAETALDYHGRLGK